MPEVLDRPPIGAQEGVDPEATTRRIFAAHHAAHYNSTHAARLLGLTYQGLRQAILRFDQPRHCADGTIRKILFDIGDGEPKTLNAALSALRASRDDAVEANRIRVVLNVFVAEGGRLADVARKAGVEASRLTQFRSRTRLLQADVLVKVEDACIALRASPLASKPGRRASS